MISGLQAKGFCIAVPILPPSCISAVLPVQQKTIRMTRESFAQDACSYYTDLCPAVTGSERESGSELHERLLPKQASKRGSYLNEILFGLISVIVSVPTMVSYAAVVFKVGSCQTCFPLASMTKA